LNRTIADHPELLDAIVALCEPDQDADARIRAALVRAHWDIAGSADTFASITHASGASITRPMTCHVRSALIRRQREQPPLPAQYRQRARQRWYYAVGRRFTGSPTSAM
jgi:hypothetical protein